MAQMETEKMRAYMQVRRARLRKFLIAMLGGICVKCSSKEELEFDHIDPKTKNFTISSGLDKPYSILIEEVKKCQLLCKTCHTDKSKELSTKGCPSVASYQRRGCRCGPCVELMKESRRRWNSKYYHGV